MTVSLYWSLFLPVMNKILSFPPSLAIEFPPERELVLFPNPSQEIITLQQDYTQEGFWEIRNSSGKRVKFGLLEEEMRDISVESLENGVYFLNLFLQEGENLDRAGFIKFS